MYISSKIKSLYNVLLPICTIVLFSSFNEGEKGQTSNKSQQNSQATITDIDGNVYKIVEIGKQQWMAENLKTTKFRNGKKIANVKDSTRWAVFNSAAYCAYSNDSLKTKEHGLLYNWFTVVDSQNVCPTGWHVPTDKDWNILVEYVGGSDVAGGKLKDTTNIWPTSFGASNESGFNGLPSGCRTDKGTFNSLGYYGLWWSSTENYTTYAWYRCLNYNSINLFRHYYYKRYGFSIRCLKD